MKYIKIHPSERPTSITQDIVHDENSFTAGSYFSKGLWAYYWNNVNIFFALFMIIKISSDQSFAHIIDICIINCKMLLGYVGIDISQ